MRSYKRIIVLAMGGSRLAPDVLNIYKPELDIRIHSDFGLPILSDETLAESLIIANSYSGNTAESINGLEEALSRGLNTAVIAGGGELVKIAAEHNLPFARLEQKDMAARLGVGHNFVALARMINIEIPELQSCGNIDVSILKQQGRELAEFISDRIPLIYTTDRLNELGYIWKVILNETAKIPAFSNRFPELNHNEINSFDGKGRFCVLTIDDQRSIKLSRRISAAIEVIKEKSVHVKQVDLDGDSLLQKIVTSMILAHQTALFLAEKSGRDPIATPIVDQLKKLA